MYVTSWLVSSVLIDTADKLSCFATQSTLRFMLITRDFVMPWNGTTELTRKENDFIREFVANGGNREKAEKKAGYAPASTWRVLQRPEIQRQIAQHQLARLTVDAAPLAVNTLIEIMKNPKAPAAARVQASKVVIDRALPTHEDGKIKDLHEMTPEEIAAAITRLETLASDAAKDVTQGKEPDLFG